ncbi:CocE/NonD family hydrolase [Terrimonas sp. NA20]|uniref:CocE/NonD family hydrolase n=1 Tax=Terrimonas ginsenosidimutans TaxID=2908004 RepID=A0ABS9KXD3_9BACT|nr:CocE/NonD family hydrolase [Terrimonas ginsenosidimutans]MCG2617039.1 CocE/NonD family hydrolase [Terrimonas ginsenosidimutans]
MRRLLVYFLMFMLPLTGFSQHEQDSAWVRENYTKREVYIPMRDGIKLFTAVYAPKDMTEKHPILMTRTPYSCAPYGDTLYPSNLWLQHLRYYLREGYIIVRQDVRGRWMSEGEFMDVRPFNKDKKSNSDIDEASDTYDAIDWMVKNIPGNNGNVGVFGISYPGFYSTMAAASAHPALKAVSPQAPVTDWFMGDDFHHNGAFFQMDGFRFYSSFGKPRPKPTTIGPKGFEFPVKDAYKFYLEAGSLAKLGELMGDSIRFWKEMYSHPNYDAWWKARDARTAMYHIKPATLVVGGLFDAEDCYGAWNLYKAIEKQSPSTNNKIVMGPWYHGQWASRDGGFLGNVKFGSNTALWYQNNIEIPFFNFYLKGKGKNPELPEASIFFTGENAWKKFEQWPPAATSGREIYFSADNQLSWDKPTSKVAPYSYISDPAHPVPYTEDVHFNRTREYMTDDQRFASRRPDVLTFQTAPLENDLTLAGEVIANLKTSITGTDADFVVKIIDVFPDDFAYPGDVPQPGRAPGGSYPMNAYQMLVRGEIMRGKFRNSFSEPVPFKPGKVETVKFSLPDVAHTFKKGHRLMIQVQSSWFPLADRNPQVFMDIYKAQPKDFKTATISIYHDNVNSSSVTLPVLR